VTVGVAALSGCAGEPSSAADGNGPLPTIGLGSDLSDAATIPADLVADDAADIDSIVMIGDSITVASTPALEDRFAQLGFDDVVIEAMTGKRMAVSFGDNPSGADVARFVASADDADASGELWVVALGTNDINQYGGVDEIAASVNEVLAEVPADVPLVWVDTYYRDQSDGADLVNAVVADRLSRRGDAVMAPWNAFASGDDVLRSDGIHPSTSGTEVFADVVRATVEGFLGR
jgi:lysophospholipase L1-like esterase